MNKKMILAGLFLVLVAVALLQVPVLLREFSGERAQQAAAKKAESFAVTDTELAKVILNPDRPQLDIARDPFLPLEINQSQRLPDSAAQTLDGQKLRQEIKFLGVVVVGGETRAILEVKSKKGIFKTQDRVEGFTISGIDKEQISLENNQEVIIIKRGSK